MQQLFSGQVTKEKRPSSVKVNIAQRILVFNREPFHHGVRAQHTPLHFLT